MQLHDISRQEIIKQKGGTCQENESLRACSSRKEAGS